MNEQEKKYQKEFCVKYFGSTTWEQEVHHVDVILKGKRGQALLYIEFKYVVSPDSEARRKALAQAVITNWLQEHRLDKIAIAYQDPCGNDVLEVIDCSENSVIYNNDINWSKEIPSKPSKDAIDRINDRITNKVTRYINEDIKALYKNLRDGNGTAILITESNINVVYNEWKNAVKFRDDIKDEQVLVNIFLADILNGTKYEIKTLKDVKERTLFGDFVVGKKSVGTGKPFLREGTDMYKYVIEKYNDKVRIVYDDRIIYQVKNKDDYDFFWMKYHRPPEQEEFMKIIEHSNRLYSEEYRRDTGGEYTPWCFVKLQNKLLADNGYNLKDYIVCDPCAGVGNLENAFGIDYKQYCYLSTLEQTDVDICKIKNFPNAICYDYLKDDKQPKWRYHGEMCDIRDIARIEGRKLMIVMNPPYNGRGRSLDLCIEFFNKVVELDPDTIVLYCKTEFFLRDTRKYFENAHYKLVSHVFSNAKTTFKLSEWSVSMVILSKEKGEELNCNYVTADRYEVDAQSESLIYQKTYTYDNVHPDLIKEIEKEIKNNMTGIILGQWVYLNSVIKLSNGGKEKTNKITSNNIKWCLLSKGLNFNTHHKYFEWNYLVYRGEVSSIPSELFNDAIMFSLFYKGLLFTNKGQKNYIMPFTAEELGCSDNDLNVAFSTGGTLFNNGNEKFDFREFMQCFDYSKEAKDLYHAALGVFRYYHHSEAYEQGRDWNDSYYDICNAIMGKDITTYKLPENMSDRRITKTKSTKGTLGFGRRTIKSRVPATDLDIFYTFFDARDRLAVKINDELLDAHLLLWKRKNIF